MSRPGSAKMRIFWIFCNREGTLQHEGFVRQSAVAPVRFAWVHSNTKALSIKALSPRSEACLECVRRQATKTYKRGKEALPEAMSQRGPECTSPGRERD